MKLTESGVWGGVEGGGCQGARVKIRAPGTPQESQYHQLSSLALTR